MYVKIISAGKPDASMFFLHVLAGVFLCWKVFARLPRSLKLKASFFGTDTTILSPALQLCDKAFLVSPTKDPRYIKQLFEIVKKNKINLIVPTVDLDLEILAKNKARFEKLGCTVLVSESGNCEYLSG